MRLAKVLLIVLLSFWSEVLGFRDNSWGSFGLSNIGWYSILQISFTLISVVLIFRNSLFKINVNILYIVLFFTLIFSFLLSGESLSSQFTNLIKIKFVLQLPVILYSINKLSTEYILKIFNKFGLIAVYALLIQFYFYFTDNTIVGNTTIFVEATLEGRGLRILSPLTIFIIFNLINLLLKFKNNFNFVTLFNLILTFTAIVFIGHRNIIVLSLILSLIVFGKIKLSMLASVIYIGISSLTISGIIEDSNILNFSSLVRLEHYSNTLVWLSNNWYGCFYDWTVYDSQMLLDSLTSNEFVKAPTGDSGWLNLILIYGIPGLIFVILIIRSSVLNLYAFRGKYLQLILFIFSCSIMSLFMALGLIGVPSGFFITILLIGLSKTNEISNS